ncbi:hypothetical protein COEREDRAFT_79809, partial [Coemansia reversa NRRL 1564]
MATTRKNNKRKTLEHVDSDSPVVKRQRPAFQPPPVPISSRSSTHVDSSNKQFGFTNTPHVARVGLTRAANNTGSETKERIRRLKAEASSLHMRLHYERVAKVPNLAQPWSKKAKQHSKALTDVIHSGLEAHIFGCDN